MSPAGEKQIPLRLWKMVGKMRDVDATSRSAKVAKQLL